MFNTLVDFDVRFKQEGSGEGGGGDFNMCAETINP